MKNRIENLDLLRALAIIMVIVFHTMQMLPEKNILLWQFSKSGKYGVDLFFALSGFLIGNLYWNEYKLNSKVNSIKFVFRRALRTIPPYLVALIPAYFAVFFARHEKFDLGYLLLIQNYYIRIPFFLVSWSLCIEEHFYFLLPFVLSLLILYKRKLYIFLGILSVIPIIFRYLNYSNGLLDDNFGYYLTATHLRFDVLILGVLASYISNYYQNIVNFLKSFKWVLVLITLIFLESTSFIPKGFMYVFGLYILGVLFSVIVLLFANSSSLVVSKQRFIHFIAISSYSIYLTHALVIHFILKSSLLLKLSNNLIIWSFMILSIIIIGYLNYLIVEKPILQLRDKILKK